MIIYFSATGNCKYVASRIVQAKEQNMISIVDCLQNNQYDFSDDVIGIISPTYGWGLPSIVKEFFEKATFQSEYLYFVATYGTTPGATGYMASKAIKGKRIDAYYSVRMVDTWTPIFDISTSKKISKYTKTTEKEIDEIINKVSSHFINKHMPSRTPAFITKLIGEPIYNKVRLTKHFHVSLGIYFFHF